MYRWVSQRRWAISQVGKEYFIFHTPLNVLIAAIYLYLKKTQASASVFYRQIKSVKLAQHTLDLGHPEWDFVKGANAKKYYHEIGQVLRVRAGTVPMGPGFQ